MKFLAYAAAVSAIVAAPAFGAEMPKIKGVDVQFDLAAVEGTPAAKFWADLEGDLEEAIAQRVAGSIAAEGEPGAMIEIDIDELDLANSFEGALGVDTNLGGTIHVSDEDNKSVEDTYRLIVKVDENGQFITDGETTEMVVHDRDEVYLAAVSHFADTVVKRLQ